MLGKHSGYFLKVSINLVAKWVEDLLSLPIHSANYTDLIMFKMKPTPVVAKHTHKARGPKQTPQQIDARATIDKIATALHKEYIELFEILLT